MLHVTAVVSSIKDGVACPLAPKTLIVGRNATGKSAVTNSIELALSGRVSDLVGRAEVAREADLMALAPARSKELFARVNLSDGTVAEWSAGGKGKSKKAKHVVPATVDPATVFPLRRVREAVLGSVETARKFFLSHAVGGVSDADVLAQIPATLHARYKKGMLVSNATTAVDKLLAVLAHAKQEARAGADRAKAHVAASADSAQGLAPLPTEETVKGLKQRHKDAQAALERLIQASGAAEAIQRAQAELLTATQIRQQAEGILTEREETYRRAEETLAGLPPPVALDPDVEGMIRSFRWHATTAKMAPSGKAPCLCCGNASVDAAEFERRLVAAEAYVSNARSASAAWHTYAAQRDDAARNLAAAKTALTTAQATEDALRASAASAVGVADPAAIDAARAAVAEVDGALAEVDRLKAAWSTSMRAREQAAEAEKDAREWKDLTEACTSAVAALLDSAVGKFTAKVQQFLPKTDHFTLTLRDGTREVFAFGLVKDGVLHTALSGVEWVRVTAALAAACMPPAGKLAVIIPEDRAFHPDDLGPVLAAFSNVEGQVIVASPIPPAGGVPAGWHVIDTAREEHRRLTGGEDAPEAPGAVVVTDEDVAQARAANGAGDVDPGPGDGFDPPETPVTPPPRIATW